MALKTFTKDILQKTLSKLLMNLEGYIQWKILQNKKQYFQKAYPVPNIGWRRVYSNDVNRRNPLFNNIIENSYFYFIHSYKVETKKKEESISQAQYGNEIICSVINNNNIYGTQFHPEKSSRQGETMIQNFLNF